MRVTATSGCPVPPEAVWPVLADIGSWPDWCPTMVSVAPDGPFAVGVTVRVVQPGLRPAVWTVDDIVTGRSFRWSTRGPGFRTAADHVLEPSGSGTTVRLSVDITGVMAWAVALISGGTIRRYVHAEAAALVQRCSEVRDDGSGGDGPARGDERPRR